MIIREYKKSLMVVKNIESDIISEAYFILKSDAEADEGKISAEAERIIRTYDEEPELQVLNGRFGPYIAYKGKNYKLPKSATPAELTLEECLEIVKQQSERESTSKGGRKYTKKKA